MRAVPLRRSLHTQSSSHLEVFANGELLLAPPLGSMKWFLPKSTTRHRHGRIKLTTQLVEQRLGVFQVAGVEALGEPGVERGEEIARFGASALMPPQACE